MRHVVRVFAGLRERAGSDHVTVELPDGATGADAIEQLSWLTGGAQVLLAVNREYATPSVVLADGDELALIPPVSGGAPDGHPRDRAVPDGRAPDVSASLHVRITPDPIDAQGVTRAVTDPRAGAVVSFLGITREVAALEYEAYAPMAERVIADLARRAIAAHGLLAVAVEHRVGTVPLSEPSVVIAVSAAHREAAFAGARELIDELKRSAPIWKREEGVWLGDHADRERAAGGIHAARADRRVPPEPTID